MHSQVFNYVQAASRGTQPPTKPCWRIQKRKPFWGAVALCATSSAAPNSPFFTQKPPSEESKGLSGWSNCALCRGGWCWSRQEAGRGLQSSAWGRRLAQSKERTGCWLWGMGGNVGPLGPLFLFVWLFFSLFLSLSWLHKTLNYINPSFTLWVGEVQLP